MKKVNYQQGNHYQQKNRRSSRKNQVNNIIISKLTKSLLLSSILGTILLTTSCEKKESKIISEPIVGEWTALEYGEDVNNNGKLESFEIEGGFLIDLKIDDNKFGTFYGGGTDPTEFQFSWTEYADKKYWFASNFFPEEWAQTQIESYLNSDDILYMKLLPMGEYEHNVLLAFQRNK